MRMRRRHFPAVVVALALGSSAAWWPAPAAAAGNEGQMAAEIAAQINAERAARGLSRLPVDGSYAAGAQRVAESNRERSCDACHSTSFPSGEVVYWSSGDASGGATAWWMNSPGHRALLMAPDATKLGIGVACSGTEYQAVGWIESENPPSSVPASPIVTSRSSGSRCQGVAPAAKPTTTTVRPSPTTTAAGRNATPEAAREQQQSGAVQQARGRATTTSTPQSRAQAKRSENATARSEREKVERRKTNQDEVAIETGIAPTPRDVTRQLGVELTGRSGPSAAATGGLGDATPLVLAAVFAGSLLAGWAGRRRTPGAARAR